MLFKIVETKGEYYEKNITHCYGCNYYCNNSQHTCCTSKEKSHILKIRTAAHQTCCAAISAKETVMKSIYIFLVQSNTILSKIVHRITEDTYTHAAISFDKNLQTLYSSSRKNGRTLFPAGPCPEHLSQGYYKQHSKIPCAVYELNVSDDAYEKAIKEVQCIMAKADQYHFNIIGLLLCQLHIPYHRKHYFFCSEFVSEVLYRSQAIKLPKDTSLMRPIDYTQLPGLICRFSGYLDDLVNQEQFSIA